MPKTSSDTSLVQSNLFNDFRTYCSGPFNVRDPAVAFRLKQSIETENAQGKLAGTKRSRELENANLAKRSSFMDMDPSMQSNPNIVMQQCGFPNRLTAFRNWIEQL